MATELRRSRIRDQVKRIILRRSPKTVSAHIRFTLNKEGKVRWAVMGLTPDGTQHTITREPCDHSHQVIGYITELLERMERSA